MNEQTRIALRNLLREARKTYLIEQDRYISQPERWSETNGHLIDLGISIDRMKMELGAAYLEETPC